MASSAKTVSAAARLLRTRHRSRWPVAGRPTASNEALVDALGELGLRSVLAKPTQMRALAPRGDVVLGRLDVRKTLDGVEDGIWDLRRAEMRGLRVLNPAPSLFACHDKLQTSLRLTRAGVPHSRTAHID